MIPPRPTQLAQTILKDAIRAGDTAIDATAGNGHDTVFLAECVGASGRVLAFDLQEQAIQSARRNVDAKGVGAQVEFHQVTHARLADYAAAESVSAVMFNLGYLPGDDHQFTTQTTETIAALSAAAHALKPGGILSVVCYPGHEAGAQEAREVEAWITVLTSEGWRVAKYGMLGTLRPAPFLIIGRKA